MIDRNELITRWQERTAEAEANDKLLFRDILHTIEALQGEMPIDLDWERDLVYASRQLVKLLRLRMCWADKMDICYAIQDLLFDYENHIEEMEHLCGGSNEPQQG